MSFIDIKNPQERDRIVQDYINTRNELRAKAENDKARGLTQQIQLVKTYTPLIKATQESSNKITEELKNNRAVKEEHNPFWKETYTKPAINYYLDSNKNLDKYFGIQKKGDHYVMGEKTITLDDKSNITVEKGSTFKASPGLWELIMLNKPTHFTEDDFEKYQDLVEETQVIFNPLTQKETDRPKSTAKWKILEKLAEQYVNEGDEDDNDEDADDNKSVDNNNEKTKSDGQGIKFLPGDINGLLDRLKLLYAERRAGNIISTTSEIVAILDELLRKKQITRKQYNAASKELSC